MNIYISAGCACFVGMLSLVLFACGEKEVVQVICLRLYIQGAEGSKNQGERSRAELPGG